MRIFSRPGVFATLAAAAVSAFVLGAGPAAMAQGNNINSGVTYKSLPKGSVRLGGYFPLNSRIRKNVGNTEFAGGVDWIISRQGASTNTYLSADYIDRSDGPNQLRLIPVTWGYLHYKDVAAATRTYSGFGLGVYFVNQDIPDSVGFRERNHTLAYGGYLNAGVEFQDNVFVDLRLHLTTSIGSANPGGAEVTAGARF